MITYKSTFYSLIFITLTSIASLHAGFWDWFLGTKSEQVLQNTSIHKNCSEALLEDSITHSQEVYAYYERKKSQVPRTLWERIRGDNKETQQKLNDISEQQYRERRFFLYQAEDRKILLYLENKQFSLPNRYKILYAWRKYRYGWDASSPGSRATNDEYIQGNLFLKDKVYASPGCLNTLRLSEHDRSRFLHTE